MSTSRISSRRLVVVAVAAAAVTASTVLVGGPAVAEDSTTAQDAYVASLLAAHEASSPYTQMDDYVRTLVFWAANPDWTPGS